MHCEHSQISALDFFPVGLLQARLVDIVLKDLADAILRVWGIPPSSGMIYVGVGFDGFLVTLADETFLLEHAFEFVHQSSGQSVGSGRLGLGVFGREEHRVPTEIDVPDLHPDELSHSAAQFIDHLKHQLAAIVLDVVGELLELIGGQVPNDLAEAFVPFHPVSHSYRNVKGLLKPIGGVTWTTKGL